MVRLLCFLAIQAVLFTGGHADFDETKVKFYLYKRGSEDNPQELSASSLRESAFNPELPTAMFIHGYGGGHLKPPAQTVKNALLSVKDTNVILVNYGPYSFPYMYLYANAQSIAKTCAGLINSLVDQRNLNIATFSLIGHSFGSHISGFTANNINGTVPEIVGLDPAGPYFENAKPENRLSEDDAGYVVCIHTSPVLGIHKAICTVDFFPNGGKNQPGCADTDDNELLFGTCSHQIAVDYFAEAIKSPEKFPASICHSDFEAKSTAAPQICSPAVGVYMGDFITERPPPGIYFVAVS